MSDYGITPDNFESVVHVAKGSMSGLFACDPVPMSDDVCLAILQNAYK